jgi:hypothetical protein
VIVVVLVAATFAVGVSLVRADTTPEVLQGRS